MDILICYYLQFPVRITITLFLSLSTYMLYFCRREKHELIFNKLAMAAKIAVLTLNYNTYTLHH